MFLFYIQARSIEIREVINFCVCSINDNSLNCFTMFQFFQSRIIMGTFIKRGQMKTTATRKINIYQKLFSLFWRDWFALRADSSAALSSGSCTAPSSDSSESSPELDPLPSPIPFPSLILATTTSVLRQLGLCQKRLFPLAINEGAGGDAWQISQ